MEALEALERLAQVARRERAPEVDVSAGVLRRIRCTGDPARLTPLWLLSLASVVTAVVVLMIGIHVWAAASDPMQALIPAAKVASLW
jgi:ADP-ribose pyrophosphatase YjhB (NUDIX family)